MDIYSTRKRVSCLKCRQETSVSNMSKHIDSKSCLSRVLNKPKTVIDGICQYCFVDISHLCKARMASHPKWCKDNPKLNEYKKTASLIHTFVSEEGRKEGSNKIKHLHEIGHYAESRVKTAVKNRGRVHSQESKNNMSIAALNSKHQRVCKSSHIFEDKIGRTFIFDSKWEDYVALSLDRDDISWTRPEAIQYLDKNNKLRNYFPDFYLPEFDLYLDPKNSYVISKQLEKLQIIQKQINLIIIDNVLDCKNFVLENFYNRISNYNLVPRG